MNSNTILNTSKNFSKPSNKIISFNNNNELKM